MLGDVFFTAFVGIFDVANGAVGLARSARGLPGSEVICFGSNNCSQPQPPQPAPGPTPKPPIPTPSPEPEDPEPNMIQVMITDGFLLLLVLLVIIAFIYCCYVNR